VDGLKPGDDVRGVSNDFVFPGEPPGPRSRTTPTSLADDAKSLILSQPDQGNVAPGAATIMAHARQTRR